MAALQEVKSRIGTVKSTLKITSAMKLVASAKLRKAQMAIEGMLPYESLLQKIFFKLLSDGAAPSSPLAKDRPVRKAAIVSVSSNGSLCGGFNAQVLRTTLGCIDSLRAEGIDDLVFIPVGKKVSDALRRLGFDVEGDRSHLAENASYERAAAFADGLTTAFLKEKFDRIYLIYNHFESVSKQTPIVEILLPFHVGGDVERPEDEGKYIVENSPEEVLDRLMPGFLRNKVYTVLLDSRTAEQAARTVAMQTATDNGEDLLEELTLEYNKGRQQKITSEILDIVAGRSDR